MPSPEPIDFRRPRGVADTLNATFVFLRDEFKSLVTTLVIIVGLPMLLSAILSSQSYDWIGMIASGDPEAMVASIEDGALFGWTYFAGLLGYLVVVTLAFGLIYAYLVLYVQSGHGGFAPAEVWARFRQSWWPYLSTFLWSLLLLVGCFVLFIVPFLGFVAGSFLMLYLSPVLAMVYLVRMETGVSFWSAFDRVRTLLRGHWGSTLLLLFISGVTISILSSAVGTSALLGYGMVHVFLGSGFITTMIGILISLISQVTYLAYAIFVVAFAIRYYGLEEVFEGVVLERRIEEMAASGEGLDPLAL